MNVLTDLKANAADLVFENIKGNTACLEINLKDIVLKL